jgi:hypothetical protein
MSIFQSGFIRVGSRRFAHFRRFLGLITEFTASHRVSTYA